MKKLQQFILTNKNRSPLFSFSLIIVGALFSFAGFAVDNLWWFSIIGFLPLFYFLFVHLPQPTKRHETSRVWRRAFLGGWLFGFIFIGTIISWFFHTLPLDWLGIESAAAGIIAILFYWGTVTIVLSFFIGLWALFSYVLATRTVFDVVLLPSLWIIFEYLRTWGFAILTTGSESFFGPHFSVGFLGYVLAESPALQFASIGGIYLLSFIALAVSVSLYLLSINFCRFALNKKTKLGVAAIALFALVLFVVPLFFHYDEGNGEGEGLTATAIHTHFGPMFSIKPVEQKRRQLILEDLFFQIGQNLDPDYVVFPESSRFLQTLLDSGRAANFITATLGTEERLIIDSSRIQVDDGDRDRLYYYNTKTGESDFHDKVFLVPQGEYTPSFYAQTWKLIGMGDFLERFNSKRAYTRGDQITNSDFQTHKAGALFCSDILSPSLYRDLAQGGSNILINVASHAWFHDSNLLYKQIKDTAKVRAVSHDRYFIQSSNVAPSFILDNRGKELSVSPWNENSVIYAEVFPRTTKTLYTRFGDWILLPAFLFAFAIIPMRMCNRNK